MSAAALPIRRPYSVVVSITPAIAESWLALNVHNRNLRVRHLQRFARDMAAGNWKMTGESIKFAVDGSLLDGQHRLAAIVESGATVDTLVTYDLPADAQSAMDSGTGRTASDALGLRGVKNAGIAAAAARLAVTEQKAPDQIGKFSATHAEIIDFLEQHPDMGDAVDYASFARDRVDCPSAIVAYTLWRLSQVDRDDAYEFWGAMAEKVGLRAGDPAIALLHRFAQARRMGEYISREGFVSAIFRAWNARRDGKPMQRVHINSRQGGVITVPVPR